MIDWKESQPIIKNIFIMSYKYKKLFWLHYTDGDDALFERNPPVLIGIAIVIHEMVVVLRISEEGIILRVDVFRA